MLFLYWLNQNVRVFFGRDKRDCIYVMHGIEGDPQDGGRREVEYPLSKAYLVQEADEAKEHDQDKRLFISLDLTRN